MTEILKYNFMKASLALAFFSFYPTAVAQHAEELFSRYWKIGITGNRATYHAENEPNSVNYELYNYHVPNVGIIWNFYQKENHNIKASILKNIKYWEPAYLRIKVEDFPVSLPEGSYDYEEITSTRISNSQWKANILYEYFFKLNEHIYLSGATGAEVLYYPKIRSWGSMGVGVVGGEEEITLVSEQTERVKDINLGIKGEVSVYFPTNIGLFQLKAGGFLGFNDYQVTHVQAFNLAVSPDSNSMHTIKGHYLGFGMSYYLPKKKKQ